MKIEQIDKEKVLEYLCSGKDVFALYTLNIGLVNLCLKSMYALRSILDDDNYVYFVLNGGDSNE